MLHYSAPKYRPQRGFALVLALSLMAFVLVLLLSIVTLVQVETSAARQTIDQLKAEQNAILGMMVGVGRLQAMTGSDRRVTTNTELDFFPNSENPHWTAVWKEPRTVQELKDMRSDLYKTAFFADVAAHQKLNAQKELVGYLVSGDSPDPAVDLKDEAGMINILPHPGSIYSVADAGQAPVYSDAEVAFEDAVRVKTESSGEEGTFAYWVADEGLKARWNIDEPDYLSELTATDDDYYKRLGSPQKAPLMETDTYEVTDEAAYSEIIAKSIDDSDLQHIDSEMVPELLHDVTASSIGLLTDVKFGGNKWDLTHFSQAPAGLVLNPETGDPLEDLDLVPYYATLERHKMLEPNMALLRSFLNPSLASGQSGHEAALKVTAHEEGEIHGFHPMIAAISLYVDFTKTNGQLRLHMFPTVVLWNPYNHPLAAQDYELDMKFVAVYALKILDVDTDKWIEPMLKYDTLLGNIYRSEFEKDVNGDYVVVSGTNHYKFESESIIGNSGNGIGYDGNPLAQNPLVNRLLFDMNDISLEPGEVAFLHLKDRLSEVGAVGGDGESNELEKNALSAMNDQHNMYIDTGIALPAGNLKFSFGYYHPSYQVGAYTVEDRYQRSNWWPWNPRLTIEEADESGDTVSKVVHEITSAVATSDTGPLASDTGLDGNLLYRVRWGDMRTTIPFPPIVPLTANVTRGRIADRSYGYMEGASMENKYNHEYAFRGPFPNSEPFAIRYLADFNYRATETDVGDVRNDYAAAFVSYMGYRGDKFDYAPEGFIVGNLASYSHPINFLGPFFEAPVGIEPLSLGVLQHANWTDRVTSPSYAFGNSLVSPVLYRDRLMVGPSTFANPNRGYNRNDIDLSYFLNDSLLDRYYFSGLPQEASWDPSDSATELPNSRMTLLSDTPPTAADLQTLEGAADYYGVVGAFNINSTSVYAWSRMLSSFEGLVAPTRDGSARVEPLDGDGALLYPHPFARSQFPSQGQADYQDLAYDEVAHLSPLSYKGYRSLSSAEVESLATEIVRLVKARGPFVSLSDFANRKVSAGVEGLMGILQEAIDASGVNSDFDDEAYSDTALLRLIPEHNTGPTGRNLPGFLSQADIIDALAPVISARSDTFRVRGYGESQFGLGDADKATAVCEAVVQRLPESVGSGGDFGRQYRIVSFRWLNSEDI